MSAVLKNNYGKIIYDDRCIAIIAGISATECYGLVGMSQKNAAEVLANLFKSGNLEKGVHVKANGSEDIEVKLYITVKYGVSLSAVAENIIDKVKYSIEKETGLNVTSVDIVVQGIQI